jgi:2-polyprenyl-6-hydroxyphenyl methylase/3-demethylubiquinone-9 3-methyltransferase
MKTKRTQLYQGRRLAQLYPDLDRLYDASFNQTLAPTVYDPSGIDRQLAYVDRLIDVPRGRLLVVGCGPQPTMMQHLIARGHDAVAIEPVAAFVREARERLGSSDRVLEGAAESIPMPDASVQLVYCNSVLEHVDSPLVSLREMARVLRPGGAAFIFTTNRFRVSLRGDNGEYALPFFNWLPAVVRECFAFHHLHYDPRLANYTDRPAVHWFSYSDLCALGRDAGFAHFYSTLDLLDGADPVLAQSRVKRWLVTRAQVNPWLRALVLTTTYFGGIVLMVKRARANAAAADDALSRASTATG